jgi:hypothetical protein
MAKKNFCLGYSKGLKRGWAACPRCASANAGASKKRMAKNVKKAAAGSPYLARVARAAAAKAARRNAPVTAG